MNKKILIFLLLFFIFTSTAFGAVHVFLPVDMVIHPDSQQLLTMPTQYYLLGEGSSTASSDFRGLLLESVLEFYLFIGEDGKTLFLDYYPEQTQPDGTFVYKSAKLTDDKYNSTTNELRFSEYEPGSQSYIYQKSFGGGTLTDIKDLPLELYAYNIPGSSIEWTEFITNFSFDIYLRNPKIYGYDASNISSTVSPPDTTSWVDLQYPDNYTFYDEFINHETGPFLQISYNQIQDISKIYLNGKTIFSNKKYSWLGYENDAILDFIEGDPDTLSNGTLQISLYDEAIGMFTKTNNKVIIEYCLEPGLYADTYKSEFNFTFGSGGVGNDFTDVELIGDTIFEGIDKPELTDGIGAWIDYFVKMVLAIVTAPFRLITLAVQNLNTYIGNFAESITAIFSFFPLWLNSLILTSLTIGIFMRVLGR